MEGSLFSYCIREMSSGDVVEHFQKDLRLTPASSIKSVTTLTAWRLFDKDHCFETELQLAGRLNPDGVFIGDLIVRGNGDPSFLSPHYMSDPTALLDDWRGAMKKEGIRDIRGRIVVLDEGFSGYPLAEGVIAEDVGNYYGGGSFSFNCFDNTYSLLLNSNESTVSIESYQGIDPNLDFNISAKTNVSGRDEAYIMALPYSTSAFVKGSIPVGKESFEIKGSYPDPARAFANYFRNYLNKNGFPFSGKTSIEREYKPRVEPRTIASHCSPDISELITRTNRKSLNLYADVLLRHCGLALGGNGDIGPSAAFVEKYWREQGAEIQSFGLQDGSGLSRLNQISTSELSSILSLATEEERAMLIAGFKTVDGKSNETLYYKSGYMKGVKAMAGYIKRKNGQWYSFSAIAERHSLSPVVVQTKMIKLLMN